MKKIHILTVILIVCLSGIISSCANVLGLHNQLAAEIVFVFKNFPSDVSGSYSIPGNFNNWDNSTVMVSMKDGNGSSNPVLIANANIQFSLVRVNDWNRSWFPTVTGNGVDGSANKYHNFYIDDLSLDSGEIVIVIDGSDLIAIPIVGEL